MSQTLALTLTSCSSPCIDAIPLWLTYNSSNSVSCSSPSITVILLLCILKSLSFFNFSKFYNYLIACYIHCYSALVNLQLGNFVLPQKQVFKVAETFQTFYDLSNVVHQCINAEPNTLCHTLILLDPSSKVVRFTKVWRFLITDILFWIRNSLFSWDSPSMFSMSQMWLKDKSSDLNGPM